MEPTDTVLFEMSAVRPCDVLCYSEVVSNVQHGFPSELSLKDARIRAIHDNVPQCFELYGVKYEVTCHDVLDFTTISVDRVDFSDNILVQNERETDFVCI